jgi:hypothetical protein
VGDLSPSGERTTYHEWPDQSGLRKNASLFQRGLDLHLVRASMVIMSFFFAVKSGLITKPIIVKGAVMAQDISKVDTNRHLDPGRLR